MPTGVAFKLNRFVRAIVGNIPVLEETKWGKIGKKYFGSTLKALRKIIKTRMPLAIYRRIQINKLERSFGFN